MKDIFIRKAGFILLKVLEKDFCHSSCTVRDFVRCSQMLDVFFVSFFFVALKFHHYQHIPK